MRIYHKMSLSVGVIAPTLAFKKEIFFEHKN